MKFSSRALAKFIIKCWHFSVPSGNDFITKLKKKVWIFLLKKAVTNICMFRLRRAWEPELLLLKHDHRDPMQTNDNFITMTINNNNNSNSDIYNNNIGSTNCSCFDFIWLSNVFCSDFLQWSAGSNFSKLLPKICKIFLNFKVLSRSSYS